VDEEIQDSRQHDKSIIEAWLANNSQSCVQSESYGDPAQYLSLSEGSDMGICKMRLTWKGKVTPNTVSRRLDSGNGALISGGFLSISKITGMNELVAFCAMVKFG
jgi:hypothetical protein